MKKSTKYIILAVVLIIIASIAKSVFVYRPPLTGKVIDAVTKKPLEGIKVHRVIQLESCFFECFSYVAASPSTKTNKNGFFRFWPKIISQLPPPSGRGFYAEDITVNLADPLKPGYEIDVLNYYFKRIKDIEKSDIQEIELIPVVDSVEECQGNEECVGENSFSLALKNKNENLCLNINLSSTSDLAEISSVPQSICVDTIAILKEDPNACNVLESGYFRNTCRDDCLFILKASEEGERKYFENYLHQVSCYHNTLDSIKRKLCLESLNHFFEQKAKEHLQLIKETKAKYQQIISDPKAKYCETDEDCDIAYSRECCWCILKEYKVLNKEYVEAINKLPDLCLYQEIHNCFCGERGTKSEKTKSLKCVNNSCKYVLD